jgi:YD repeat-containing protein
VNDDFRRTENARYGMWTQTRTFAYTSTAYSTLNLPALWLTSVTNPENGTVSYTYNADGTLATKKDANGNTESYTYDAYQRLTAIPDRQQTFTYVPARPTTTSAPALPANWWKPSSVAWSDRTT